jgi:wyosine [tRNA(Phe)-imidazoG37] synthetase (radical SAM superfamily)
MQNDTSFARPCGTPGAQCKTHPPMRGMFGPQQTRLVDLSRRMMLVRTTSPFFNLTPMTTHQLHTDHARLFEHNRFVYPVLSRRSGGISVGVNLNPDKICNFDCIYCQVDRRSQSETRFVAMEGLLEELRTTLELVASGAIYETPKFHDVPQPLRRLNDIAFSGDGEPTTYKNFDEIIEACADVKCEFELRINDLQSEIRNPKSEIKMVLITNASMFHRSHVQRGLEILNRNNGEIWAKLEAGTDEYYHLIERTPIPFRQILDNITAAARIRPLVIQSLFMRVGGEPPSPAELEAFCDRLNEITAAGGQLKLVQIYTVARRPAESYVSPLSDVEVDGIVRLVNDRTGLPALAFYGSTDY